MFPKRKVLDSASGYLQKTRNVLKNNLKERSLSEKHNKPGYIIEVREQVKFFLVQLAVLDQVGLENKLLHLSLACLQLRRR